MEKSFTFQWHITYACDQRCGHCYIFRQNEKEAAAAQMEPAQIRKVIETCEAFANKLHRSLYFAITGGDPILHPYFWPLMELIKERGHRAIVMGNPFHLTKEICERLAKLGVSRYQVSLDGMEKTHDSIRKKGSFRKTLEAIPMISASGMDAGVMMTVSELNYRELPEVMDAAEKSGADVFTFARYVPQPGEKYSGIPPLEYRALLDTYMKKREEYRNRGSFTDFVLKDHLLALYCYEEGLFVPPEYTHVPGEAMPAGCHCANANLSILPDGSVLACRRTESSGLGNIFKDDLTSMWERCKAVYRRYEKHEACGNCRLSPWCRGCPAVAAAVNGDYFAKDPQCWIGMR